MCMGTFILCTRYYYIFIPLQISYCFSSSYFISFPFVSLSLYINIYIYNFFLSFGLSKFVEGPHKRPVGHQLPTSHLSHQTQVMFWSLSCQNLRQISAYRYSYFNFLD
jgi:hypothetical protein